MATRIFINTATPDTAKARTISLDQLASKAWPVMLYGDNRDFEFVFHNDGTVESWSGDASYGLRVTLGNVNLGPTDGTYTLTCGANTTEALLATTDAAGIEEALNALASVTLGGGLTVTGEFPSFFITWNDTGNQTAITADATNLIPMSGIVVTELQAGTGSVTERLALTLRQNAILDTQSFTTVSTPYAGWTGSLNTETAEMLFLLLTRGVPAGDMVSVSSAMTVSVITPSGDERTYYQPAITLRAKNSDLGATGSAGVTGYVLQGPITTSGLTMSTSRLLGRTTASTGAIEEISVGTGLTLTAGVLASTGFANPMTTLGDTIYGGASGVATRLAGNTSATLAVLTQTGTGSASAAPVWTSTTGTGNIVRATSPTLVTPTIGDATASKITASSSAGLLLEANNGTDVALFGAGGGAGTTFYGGISGTSAGFTGAVTGLTFNGLTVTTTTGTLTLTNGKTLSVSNTLTLAGTDGTTLTFPSTSATIARTDAAQTFTGTQTFSGTVLASSATAPLVHIRATANGINPILRFEGWDRTVYTGLRDDGADDTYFIAADAAAATPYLEVTPATKALKIYGPLSFGGTSSITSASGQALVLATGTSGTALSIASATNIATFSAGIVGTSLTMTGDIGITKNNIAVNLTASNTSVQINLASALGTRYNWRIATNETANDFLEFIPSTTAGGSTYSNAAFAASGLGSFRAGTPGSTNMTDGFLYVPSCAGTPTGTPTAITNMIPVIVDRTNNKLYFYSNSAWRDAGP